MIKALVLLSGGLDSSVNLALAKESFDVRMALTINYGQRALQREIAAARAIAKHYAVEHKVIELPFFSEFKGTSLIDREVEVPRDMEVDLGNHDTSLKTKEKVWVPNRNGIFLNVAAGIAEANKIAVVIPGFNNEEAATFPDNSREFLEAVNEAFRYSTSNKVRVDCLTSHLDKTDIMKRAIEINLPLHFVWPCYLDLEKPCGTCESCQRFIQAEIQAVLK